MEEYLTVRAVFKDGSTEAIQCREYELYNEPGKIPYLLTAGSRYLLIPLTHVKFFEVTVNSEPLEGDNE